MPNNFRPADGRRLYHQVADRLREVMNSGEFAVGSKLPPERDLAQQLGVSRPSLREALIALEIDGRVEIRMGSGVYVCAQPAAGHREASALGESPMELMQARAALESSVIVLATARATRPGLDRVEEALAGMRRDNAAGRPPLENDRRFHVAIAEMTGNSVLARLVGGLFDERHGLIASFMTRRAENSASWNAALLEHERVLGALESRDPLAASAYMSAHLLASHGRWLTETAPPQVA